MDVTTILVIVAFAAIVIGVGVYKHTKKKAEIAAKKASAGGAGGKSPSQPQELK